MIGILGNLYLHISRIEEIYPEPVPPQTEDVMTIAWIKWHV
jgi:hypothetical protein